jgi:hypothetical protein
VQILGEVLGHGAQTCQVTSDGQTKMEIAEWNQRRCAIALKRCSCATMKPMGNLRASPIRSLLLIWTGIFLRHRFNLSSGRAEESKLVSSERISPISRFGDILAKCHTPCGKSRGVWQVLDVAIVIACSLAERCRSCAGIPLIARNGPSCERNLLWQRPDALPCLQARARCPESR